MKLFKNKVPLMNGKPHEITNLIKEYILQNNKLFCSSYVSGNEKFISPTSIDRAICDIMASVIGINKWLFRNLHCNWSVGLKKRSFYLKVISWVQAELNYDDKKIWYLWRRTQKAFDKAPKDDDLNKLAKPKRRSTRIDLKN